MVEYFLFNGHISFEFQTRNYITCFGHICNHPHGQVNQPYTKIHIDGLNHGIIADVTETRNVIPSLEFKTYMTIKS